MMAFSHVVLGVMAASAAEGVTTGTALSPMAVVAAGAGSLMPDIDSPHSWLGRRLPFISWPLAGLIGHRGLTHSLVIMAIIAAVLVFYAPPVWGRAFLVAYLVHIGADMLTNSGVPLMWPSERRYRVLGIQTGGIVEWVGVTATIAACAVAIYSGAWPAVMRLPL